MIVASIFAYMRLNESDYLDVLQSVVFYLEINQLPNNCLNINFNLEVVNEDLHAHLEAKQVR
jgi:hypothetical protein